LVLTWFPWCFFLERHAGKHTMKSKDWVRRHPLSLLVGHFGPFVPFQFLEGMRLRDAQRGIPLPDRLQAFLQCIHVLGNAGDHPRLVKAASVIGLSWFVSPLSSSPPPCLRCDRDSSQEDRDNLPSQLGAVVTSRWDTGSVMLSSAISAQRTKPM
jgi:hypothetical protein